MGRLLFFDRRSGSRLRLWRPGNKGAFCFCEAAALFGRDDKVWRARYKLTP